jgi:nitroreductase
MAILAAVRKKHTRCRKKFFMTHDTSWSLDPSTYPVVSGTCEQLRHLLQYAILASSSHNTQPWRFQLASDHVDVLADRQRALAVVDPHDRALVISCGAAIGMLLVAMRRFGHAGEVDLLPSGDPDLLARVRQGPSYTPTSTDMLRFEAICQRRTTRTRFAEEAFPSALGQALQQIANSFGVEAVIPSPPVKQAVASLVAEGDRAQFANALFRRELGAWVHSRRSTSRDGISGTHFGMPDMLSPVGALVIRTFDMGNGIAAKDLEIASGSPALLLICTATDQARDWMTAGMAHAEMLLAITAAGLTTAYLNQPVEVDQLRSQLREVAGSFGIPQLLLRVGRGPKILPAVRRPLDEVIERAIP